MVSSATTQPEPATAAASGAGAAVEVSGVSFRYGDRVALDGVSFSVPRGEIFGLLGPNGSGKTTLFRVLSTLIPPQSGTLAILGKDLARETFAVRHRIGVVFQAPSLDKKLTAQENLIHHGHLYGLRGADLKERCRKLLDRVGLLDRANERTETLSGGQRRRVELAKGLLHEPDVLILDEPSTGLDPGARRDLMTYLRSLSREGVTCLLTTHLMEEAESCDRLALLCQGKLAALDTPDALKARIGGEVVSVNVREPEGFAARVQERFGVSPQVVDGVVRIERTDGPRFVAELAEAFPGQIEAVRVGRPTLEDVFIRLTGHRFWEAQSETDAAAKDKSKKKGR